MNRKLVMLFLLAGTALFARTRFFVGFGFGGFGPVYEPAPFVAYAPPPVYYAPPPVYYAPPVAYAAPYPGPGYAWIPGYSYPAGARWAWRAGYWGRRPFAGAIWVRPRSYGGRYFAGYWRR
jgi:hypothetical protein